MESRHQRRRTAARIQRVAQLALRDPRFNLREIVKHMLLVEDHLLHKARECQECIAKHLLTIEAFAEEAQTLDTTCEFSDILRTLVAFVQGVQDSVCRKDATSAELGQLVREARKALCQILDQCGGEVLARTAAQTGDTVALQAAVVDGVLVRATDDLSADYGSWELFHSSKVPGSVMQVSLLTDVPLETATALVDFNTAAPGDKFADGQAAWATAKDYISDTLFTVGG